MSVQSKPYYWVRCDNCNTDIDYGEFSALEEEAQAVTVALESDWTTDGVTYHCHRCPNLAKCENCGKPAGENAMDRDDYCPTCFEVAAGDRT